jgi:hypothetical protein
MGFLRAGQVFYGVIGCFGRITLETVGQPGRGTANPLTSAIQNVRVNHGRSNIAALQKVLNGSSITALAWRCLIIDSRVWVFASIGQLCGTI